MKILLIEDDDVLIKVLTKSLKPHRYILDVVKDGEMGWTYGSTFEYDLIMLDIVLPKLDGISLCQRFRAEGFTTPILLLTSQDTITAKVRGLDAGADDYVVKPFDPAELVARIRALLRRSSTTPLPLLSWGDLLLNLSTCEVSYNGQPLTLSAMEYELLELLLRDSQHVFSTDELIDRLWSSEQFPSEATVRSHIRRVRQKLVSVGAPKDFIATVHGRGYYLKAPVTTPKDSEPFFATRDQSQPLTPSTTELLTAKANNREQLLAGQDRALASKPEYLAFLNETWTATKPKSLEQINILFQIVRDLKADQLRSQQQKQAQQIAHKLAGTLGIFGLTKSVQAARQLESCLDCQICLYPEQALLIHTLATTLQQDIEDTVLIQMSQITEGLSPLLLLATSDSATHQSLVDIAATRGIRIQIASIPTEITSLTTLESISGSDQQPDAILFQLPTDSAESDTHGPSTPQAHNLRKIWRMFEHLYPDTPILVMGERGELSDRIQATRWGGKLFLEAQTPPEQIIEGVIQFLGRSKLPNKVMILDDDQDWLCALPALLKPWGFKVTTLANPQQFWTVLKAVTPDALVLDVNMPQINGFELCQLLRNDPYWRQLPVLFLSALTDPSSQSQAFKAGADDYLCKPVRGGELAHRILNRLQRRVVSYPITM